MIRRWMIRSRIRSLEKVLYNARAYGWTALELETILHIDSLRRRLDGQ